TRRRPVAVGSGSVTRVTAVSTSPVVTGVRPASERAPRPEVSRASPTAASESPTRPEAPWRRARTWRPAPSPMALASTTAGTGRATVAPAHAAAASTRDGTSPRRSARAASLTATVASDTHQVPEGGQLRLADAAHIEEPVDAGEGPVPLPVVDDRRRRGGADAGQRLEHRRVGRVEVHR